MYELLELFKYDYFTHAIYASVLASISCGIIGTYIVSKRMVFISGGITHASFGGIGIGYFLGLNPLYIAGAFSIIVAWTIEFLSKKKNIRQDSAIGILWSFGMAVGIIFIYITPGYAPNMMSFLFGSIMSVALIELILMIAIAALIIIVFLLFYRYILYIAFDEEYAKTQRIPVNFINYLLITLIALTIVINIRIVGVILVISLLTIPQTTANLISKNFVPMILYSIGFGLIGTFSGIICAYFFNIPSGATIIFTLVLIFLIVKLLKLLNKNNSKTLAATND